MIENIAAVLVICLLSAIGGLAGAVAIGMSYRR